LSVSSVDTTTSEEHVPRPSVEAQRREQILEAASAVIAEVGLQGLRLTDVAKLAGVSSGTVTYYFDTKKELVNDAFEFNFANSLRRHQWILESGNPPLDVLRLLVDSYLPDDERSLLAWRVWAELWAEGMRDKSLQEVNERLYGQWRDIIAGLIRAAQDQGVARSGDPVRLSNMLVGMLDGLAVQVLLQSGAMTLAQMRETCRGFIDDVIAIAH
jgi:AcrR family transcriptional regulator